MFAIGERGQIQKLFVRICMDSGYTISSAQAAGLTASIMDTHPISVLAAFGFDKMTAIAAGNHPELETELGET